MGITNIIRYNKYTKPNDLKYSNFFKSYSLIKLTKTNGNHKLMIKSNSSLNLGNKKFENIDWCMIELFINHQINLLIEDKQKLIQIIKEQKLENEN